ncbi:MAG: protease modulator HflC [Phycisphaerae bacterium]
MKILASLVVAIVLIAAIVFSSALYTVSEFEYVVITEFGKPVRIVTEAGLRWKTPFIQKVTRIEKRILSWDGDPNDVITKDLKSIYIDTIARWRIVDPKQFYISLTGQIHNGMKKLDDIVDGVVRDIIGENTLIEVVRSTNRPLQYEVEEMGPGQRPEQQSIEVGREKIVQTIFAQAREGLEERFGIELIDVRIKRVNYTETVRQDVYNRMQSERNRISERYLSEAKEEQNKILGDMQKELATIEGEASQRSAEIRGEADATVIDIYAGAIRQAPEFYRFLRTLEAYRNSFDSKTIIILSTDSPFLRLLKEEIAPDGLNPPREP